MQFAVVPISTELPADVEFLIAAAIALNWAVLRYRQVRQIRTQRMVLSIQVRI